MKFTSEEVVSLPSYTAIVAPLTLRSTRGLNARFIMGGDEAAWVRPSHEQNAQIKFQKCLVVLTRDTRKTRADAAKSSTAQTQYLRPVGRKYSGVSRRQRQTAAQLKSFMTGIRTLMKACSGLWQKLCARSSEHAFDQGNRVPGSRVATHLDIRDRASTQTGCLSQVPNCPIDRSVPSKSLSCSPRGRANGGIQ
jgi:hypothetical protein